MNQFTAVRAACRIGGVAALLLTLGAFGCAPGLPQVEGVVTLDGEPLAGGFVSFQPTSGGAMATAKIEADGRYSLQTGGERGVAAGTYGVAITSYTTRPSSDGQNPPQPSLASPKKYNDPATSGFEVVVEPGPNTFDFELTSEE